MASIISHAFSGFMGSRFFKRHGVYSWKVMIVAMLMAMVPDLDVLGFYAHIPYGNFLGHRGFSHSLLCAFILGFLAVLVVFKEYHPLSRNGFLLWIFFALCAVSHGVLDALTDGGLGVAFFSPFNEQRYFFPWRPIPVAPLRLHPIFSLHLWRILKYEIIYIWLPLILIWFFLTPSKHKK